MQRPSVRAFVVHVTWLSGLALSAAAQDGPAALLVQAESLYARGEVQPALELLAGSEADISGEHLAPYYRLVTLVQLGSNSAADASVTALRLLHSAPGYEPAPTDPEAFVALMRAIKEELATAGATAMSCEVAVADALTSYRDGDYASGEEVLSRCLNERLMYLSEAEYVPALRLLALLNLRQGEIGPAGSAAARLLKLKPGYTPDPVLDPPGYRSLVELLRSRPSP